MWGIQRGSNPYYSPTAVAFDKLVNHYTTWQSKKNHNLKKYHFFYRCLCNIVSLWASPFLNTRMVFASCCLNHKTRLYLPFFSFNSHYFFLRPNPFLYEVVSYLLLSLRNPVITNRFVLKWELITPADLQRK